MSSESDETFPAIGLNVPAGRKHIARKTQAAWTYIYTNCLQDADFFLKADPDTYVVVENLREYLTHFDTDKAQYFGHSFLLPERFGLFRNKTRITYMSGGAGLVISREALRRLVEVSFIKNNGSCIPDGVGMNPRLLIAL